MNQSTSIKEIAKALVTFHVKVGTITKDASNPFFKSKYASLSNILEAINEPLSESGLSIAQFPTGQNGLTTILMHSSGEWMSAEYEMKPVKDDPQGRGSSITYQRRYALAAILSLNIDEDDDANQASYVSHQDDRKWLNKGTKEWDAIVKRLTEGTAKLADIKKHFKLNKENEKDLASIKQQFN